MSDGKDDWADDVAYDLIKEAVTACDDSYSTDYELVVQYLRQAYQNGERRGRAMGMREAAEIAMVNQNMEYTKQLGMSAIKIDVANNMAKKIAGAICAAAVIDPPNTKGEE